MEEIVEDVFDILEVLDTLLLGILVVVLTVVLIGYIRLKDELKLKLFLDKPVDTIEVVEPSVIGFSKKFDESIYSILVYDGVEVDYDKLVLGLYPNEGAPVLYKPNLTVESYLAILRENRLRLKLPKTDAAYKFEENLKLCEFINIKLSQPNKLD